MDRERLRDGIILGAAVLAPLAAAAGLLPWRTSLALTTVALLLTTVTVLVAALGNRVAGALAALSAAAWFDFFFTPPYLSFAITSALDVQTAVLMLIVGVVVAQLAARARRFEIIAITDAGYLSLINQISELSRLVHSPAVVVNHVKGDLVDLLQLGECRFERGSLLGHPPRLCRDGSVIAGARRWATNQPLRELEIELRAYGNGHYYGRFMMTPKYGSKPDGQARAMAVVLADMVGAALAATA